MTPGEVPFIHPGEVSHPPKILVLLPVYNGEKFLREQIDSILAQSHKNLQLICRDDGSTDKSPEILKSYVARFPQQIQVLQDNKGNLGAAGSFSALMQWAFITAGAKAGVYVSLADQDDTWHVDKLARCLQAMINTEKISPDIPVLVHSDLRVVDADGDEIAASFMQYQGLDPTRTGFLAQLVSNTVSGCTSLMNMALLQKALPVPLQAVMHDWWLSLVASVYGRLIFLPDALVEYRQHGRNTLGATRSTQHKRVLRRFSRKFTESENNKRQKYYREVILQSHEFCERYGQSILSRREKVLIELLQSRECNGGRLTGLVFWVLRTLA